MNSHRIHRWAIPALILMVAGSCALPLNSGREAATTVLTGSKTVRVEVSGGLDSKGTLVTKTISQATVTVLSSAGEKWGSGSLTYANGWWTGDIEVSGTGPAVVRVAGSSAAGTVFYFGRTEATIAEGGPTIKVTLVPLNDAYDVKEGTTTTFNYDTDGATGGSLSPVTPVTSTTDPDTKAVTLWADFPGSGTLVKTGYRFAAWLLEPVDSLTLWVPGQPMGRAANEPCLFHAIWVPDTLTFDNSNPNYLSITGNGSTDAASVPSGTVVLPIGVTDLKARGDLHSLFTDPANDPNTRMTRLVIPSSVTSIGEGTCRDCTALKSVVLPPSVDLGASAFANDSALESVTFGNGANTVGTQAFEGCSSLTLVQVKSYGPPDLGAGAFSGTPAGMRILVPGDVVADYKAAPGWSNYASQIFAAP